MKKFYRQVYFYEMRLSKYNQISNEFTRVTDFSEELIQIFNKLNLFDYNKIDFKNSRYLKKSNGSYDFIQIDEVSNNSIKGKIINSDDIALEYYEECGELKPLKDYITGERKYFSNCSFHNLFRYTNTSI